MSADENDNAANEPQYQGEAILLRGRVDALERERAESKEEEKKYKNAQLRFNKWLVISNIFLVVCTAATGGIGLRQAYISNIAAVAARDAANAASSNAEIAYWALMENEETAAFTLGQMQAQTSAQAITANATQGALANARESFRQEQRPYLFAQPRGGIRDPNDPKGNVVFQQLPNNAGYSVGIAAEITNAGRSPATNVYITDSLYKIGPRESVEREVADFVPSYRNAGEIAVGLGVVPSSVISLVNSETVQHLQDGTWEFFIVGGAQYADAQAKAGTRPYQTLYCWRVVMIGLPFANCPIQSKFHESMK